MPIKVACKCGQSFAAKDELAGRTIKCPKCQTPLTIPKANAAPAQQEVATHLNDLLDQEGFAAHIGVRCTRCNQPIPPGGMICIQCGQNIQTGIAVATNIKSQNKNPGHGEAVETILSRAAEELRKSPPPKDETAGGMAVSYLLTVGMIVITAGVAAGGYFMFRLLEGSADKAYTSGWAMTWIGSGLIGLGLIWIVVLGFIESALTGFLCLIPLYQFYYGLVKGYRFQLFLMFLGIVMTTGGIVLMIYANQTDPSKPIAQLPALLLGPLFWA